jgi:hypothetical protein
MIDVGRRQLTECQTHSPRRSADLTGGEVVGAGRPSTLTSRGPAAADADAAPPGGLVVRP